MSYFTHAQYEPLIREHYTRPPRIDTDDLDGWEDALREMAQVKQAALKERARYLKGRRERNLELLRTLRNKGSIDETYYELALAIENQQYSELVTVVRHHRYWSRVLRAIAPQPVKDAETGLTEEMIERAREHPIEDLFDGDYRVQYGKLVGLCPFHGERTPSFTIFTTDNHYHCFGCNAHGDAIDFYMRTKNCDFVTAVKELQ